MRSRHLMQADDQVIASFVSGPSTTTLLMWIYSSVRLGVSPEVKALASLMLLFVVTAVVFSSRLLNKKQ
jgi:putrescine transport system permease protein